MKNRQTLMKRIGALLCAMMMLAAGGVIDMIDTKAATTSNVKVESWSGNEDELKDVTDKDSNEETKEDNQDNDKDNKEDTKEETKDNNTTADTKKESNKNDKKSNHMKNTKAADRKAKKAEKKHQKEVAAAEEEDDHPRYTVHIGNGTKHLQDEYQDYTYDMCVKYGIEDYYELILTQMCVESGYNETVVSPTRNYGLMQISMSHFSNLESQLGLTDLRDPKQNIEAGVYMMAGYLNRYGDAQLALVCYNCGESAARRGVRSNSYSTRIVSIMSDLEEV